MSLPAYGSYKSSRAEFLGDVPAHWEVRRLKSVLAEPLKYGANEAAHAITPDWPRFVRITDIDDRGELRDDTFRSLSPDLAEPYLLSDGDLLLARSGATVGKSFLYHRSWGTCCFAGYLIRARPDEQIIDPRFLSYCCQSDFYWNYVRSDQIQSTIQNFSAEKYASLWLSLPPETEQAAIANFLDCETGKIDALVEAQRRLIELLREKRQAVISHAVTKGLDPNAPMKDSGVEWLGEVPKHWKVTQLKRMCGTITDGAHVSPETENGVYCFVSTRDVSDDGIDFEGCLRTSVESYQYLVRSGCQPVPGDVLFSKDGTIGRTVVVNEGVEFVVASSLIIIRPDTTELLPEFLHYLCQSAAVQQQVESFVKGAGLPRLSIQNLCRIVGSFPPAEEQRAIAGALQKVTGRFDDLMKEAEAAVALLQERRSALISAAVTGKIDVRTMTLAEAEAA